MEVHAFNIQSIRGGKAPVEQKLVRSLVACRESAIGVWDTCRKNFPLLCLIERCWFDTNSTLLLWSRGREDYCSGLENRRG